MRRGGTGGAQAPHYDPATVPRYLTQEWLDEARDLGADQPERPGASVRINWVVSGGPAGEVLYHEVLENGRVAESGLGSLDDPEVTLTTSWADSVGVARGDLDLNAAFMQGRVKAAGHMAKLMSVLPLTKAQEYVALQERIRAVTEF
jgi:hypothetical protein